MQSFLKLFNLNSFGYNEAQNQNYTGKQNFSWKRTLGKLTKKLHLVKVTRSYGVITTVH